MHFKIKRSTLVCPGECGKTKPNLIQDSHIVDEGSRPGHGCTSKKKMSVIHAFQKNGKITFKWLDFHLFQNFVWLPPMILFMGIYISYPIKIKTWPHEDCQRESVSAKLRKKPHLLWGTRGLCFAGERKDRLCVMNATMKIRAEVVASLVQASSSSTVSHSRENKHKWYKNTREGGSE